MGAMDMAMKPDRLLQLRQIDCLQVLARAGISIRPGERGWACPVCGDRQQCRVKRDISRWACGKCDTYGDAGDLWLALQGRPRAPRARLSESDWECLEGLLGGSTIELPPLPPPKPPMPRDELQRWWHGMARCSPAVAAWCRSRGVEPGDTGAIVRPGQLPRSRPDLQDAGPSAAFPLRTVTGEIANVVIRPLEPGGWKSKPLARGDGACRDGDLPLMYGDARRLRGARVGVLVEGNMDRLTVETLCDLPVVGARAAGDMRGLWGPWLQSLDVGRWICIPHLDTPTESEPGGVGVHGMARAVVGLNVTWWPWEALIARSGVTVDQWRASGRSDLNDLLRWWGRERLAKVLQKVAG